MGKFDGILLCTDLDGTLLNDENRVPEENIKAIEYFKSEGGMFTFTTGRVPHGAQLISEYIKPNIPTVVFNGAGLYDFLKNELLWGEYLDDSAKEVVAFVEENIPGLGLVVCTDSKVYFPIMNRWVDDYFKLENLPLDTTPYEEISEPWKKALFVTDEADVEAVRDLIANSPYQDLYSFTKSSPNYYEILPPGSSKGAGLKRLIQMLGINPDKVIAIGDNENDISMIRLAKVGVAVANASDLVKSDADIVTVSNNEGAVARIIYDLEDGKIKV